MAISDIALILKGLHWTANFARTVGAGRYLSAARQAVVGASLQRLHCEVLHTLRELSAATVLPAEDGAEIVALLNQRFCTVCKEAMQRHLDLRDHQLHCCLKTILPGKTHRTDRIVTIARSKPFDGRERDSYEVQGATVPVMKNSVWASMAGISDGKTEWGSPYRCFASNDLLSEGARFVCSRSEWQSYYHSTLVVPVRYVRDHLSRDAASLGYLAFDSPRTGAFRGVPDIFGFIGDKEAFAAELEQSATFHLAAIFADSLGMAWGHVDAIKQATASESTQKAG